MPSIPPGSIILLGALLVPLTRGRVRQVWMTLLPLASLLHLCWGFGEDATTTLRLFDYTLTPIRIDKLSLIWGYVFHIAALLGVVYALHVKDTVQQLNSLIYAGSSIGAVFAGDLLTLFVYWELTAISSVFLVWSGGTRHSLGAGMRYAILHIGSGVLVLSGALLLLERTGTLTFGLPGEYGMFSELEDWGAKLLLLGLAIKAAFPLLHCWLPDAYPESTPSGTVFLSAFTTKMAIYALARGFAGCDLLITIGAVMAIFPLFYAMVADDFRRTLAHVLNNQLGFMVVAIGIGTPLAIDGAAGQAFVHVLYKGLLFMAMGAVLFTTGSCRQSQVGGLARRMPLTCIFCLVGALSVVPLNCSFVTKGLILEAVAEAHLDTIWLLLLAGSVGAFLAAGIRVPYYAFFHGDATYEAKEAPQNMLVAMGASAILCLAIGVAPGVFYRLLPHGKVDNPYTLSHVVHQLQLLGFSCAVFALFARFAPLRVANVLLDVDWIYRRPLPALLCRSRRYLASVRQTVAQVGNTKWERVWESMRQQSGESGILGRSVSTNAMAFAAIVLLGVYLLLDY